MTPTSRKTAFLLVALLSATAAMPVASALADTPSKNVTAGDEMTQHGSTGVYDDLDRFKDSEGHPLPGHEYLFNMPN